MTIYQLLFNRLTLFIIHFSVCSEFSVAENFSIKNNKLCKTNPISEEPKMTLSHYITKDYENKSGLLTMEKQTQSNPILSTVALAKADSKWRKPCLTVGRWAFGLTDFLFDFVAQNDYFYAQLF